MLGPEACEMSCVPLESEASISQSPLELLKASPTGLQSQMFWGLIFLLQNLQTGQTDVGLRPLTRWGESLQL